MDGHRSYPAGHSGLVMSSHSSCSHEVSPGEETTVHHMLESKFNLHVTWLKMIMTCTFAHGLVIWAAVSFFQTVLWAVAGMVFIPLLPTPFLFAFKASLWAQTGSQFIDYFRVWKITFSQDSLQFFENLSTCNDSACRSNFSSSNLSKSSPLVHSSLQHCSSWLRLMVICLCTDLLMIFFFFCIFR